MSDTRAALVLIDLQTWIVGMPWEPLSGSDVVAACSQLRTMFANANVPVVVVRYLNRADDDETPGNELVDPFRPHDDEHLVTKNGLDAFDETDLDKHLRELGGHEVVLAGLSTAHGVAATAETAISLGYRVVIASDATASVNAKQHGDTLARLTALGARVRTIEDIAL